MILEGHPAGWFTVAINLTLEGKPLGTVRPIGWGESLQLPLADHIVRLEKPSWVKSHYVLKDDAQTLLASATLVGFFSTHWELELSSGVGRLEPADWFGRRYVLKQGDSVTARIETVSWWSYAWRVTADDALPAIDVLMLGFLYVTIQRRERRRNAG